MSYGYDSSNVQIHEGVGMVTYIAMPENITDLLKLVANEIEGKEEKIKGVEIYLDSTITYKETGESPFVFVVEGI